MRCNTLTSRAGSPVDLEARKRCTSVYLVQKVIPMLPSVLCEQLCSLNPGVDRLAFSVVWRMTKDGRLHGISDFVSIFVIKQVTSNRSPVS